ncbi:hypothetical protein O181_054877 [Austropuccinia psidii MF-1]|uniref:Uncharacterized protein n=1 Tax=Austropuccinia psidii MF-1 TaxID=1389203 RepID=A0A9Q3ECI3_9BASI|nr:hypothetical protein [Austropuccinia psidii MF-1]
MLTTVQRQRKKFYAIEQVPEGKSPVEDSESDSTGDAIRRPSDDAQGPKENILVEYQEARQIETFLVTSNRGMAYIHGTATKKTVYVDSSQHPFLIYIGAHFSIVAKEYLDNHFLNWEKQLLPTKARNLKSASGNMTSIGTTIKDIKIPHRKGNIRLNPEFLVLEDANIEGFLLGTDYQRMYCLDIYNSKSRHITIGTKKEKKLSPDIYQTSTHETLEELLNELKEGQLSTNLTSKQKASLLKILRQNIPAFSIGEEPLGKIRGHDIELYLDVERSYSPILRRRHIQKSWKLGKKSKTTSMNSLIWLSSER